MAQQTPNTGQAPKPPTNPNTTPPVPTPDGPGKITAGNFFAAQTQAREQGRVLDWSTKPEGDNYWLDPQRVVRYRQFQNAQAPDWQAPDWWNKQQIEAAYQYMKYKNNDQSWKAWQPLPQDDPGVTWLQQIGKPPVQYQPTWDQVWTPPTPEDIARQAAGPYAQPFGKWEDLHGWQKAYLSIFSPQPGLPGRPELSRISAAGGQGVLGALGGAAAGAALGSIVPVIGTGVGGIVGGLVGGLGTAYQAYTGTQVPILGNVLNLFNLPAMGLERTIGLVSQAKEEGWQKILDNLPAAWEASQLAYETSQVDLLNTIAQGARLLGDTTATTAGPGEVWQISRGIATPVQLEAGVNGQVRGEAALQEARQRIANHEDPLMVYSDMAQRFGDTGTFTDFMAQTVLDPMLLAPHLGGKAGELGAKLFGNERLAAAFKEGQGSILTDIAPPGIKGLLKRAGMAESEGPAASFTKYQNWIKRGYFPDGQPIRAAAELGSFEKWAGGITEGGTYKELEPAQPAGGVKGWFKYITDLTPEAKAHTFLSLFHDNVNVLLDMAHEDPAQMVDLLHQAASANPAEIGRLGEALVGSPATATVAQGLRDVLADGWDKELLFQYQAAEGKRQNLAKIADALKTTVGDVIERAVSNPAELAKSIANAGGPPVTPEVLAEFTKTFAGPDAIPMTADHFKAELALTTFDKLDTYLVRRYNLQPASSVLRMSRVLKGAQSLLLLGFNPSYFVNNAVNNSITRAASGVFGYLTTRQVESFLDRFGVTPQRLAEAVGTEGQPQYGSKIAAAVKANDWIGKAAQVVNATNDKLGVFSRLSSAQEKLESRSAYVIAMQRFYGKAWQPGKGFSRLHPTIEARLDGIAPGVKDILYSAVATGLNMGEIEKKLYSEAPLQIELGTIIDQAARDLFPEHPDAGNELLKTTMVQHRLQEYLDKGATASEAFDRIKQDLVKKVTEDHKRETAARAQDVTNRTKAEGAAGAHESILQAQTRAEHRVTSDAAAFTRLDEWTRQTQAGILRALSERDPATRIVLNERKAWDNYSKARRSIEKKYTSDITRRKGEAFTEWQTRRDAANRERETSLREAWDAYQLEAQPLHDALQAEANKPRTQGSPARTKTGQPESARTDTGPARTVTEPTAEPALNQAITPEQAAVTARTQALNDMARQYGLVDLQGRPVMRYLLNLYNRGVDPSVRTTDPQAVDLTRAEQVLQAHADKWRESQNSRAATIRDSVNKIIKESDDTTREAELVANGLMTRRLVQEQMSQVFGGNQAEIDAAMRLLDAHADVVTKAEGGTPSAATRDSWFATRIARVLPGVDNDPAARDVYNNIYQSAYGRLMAVHNLRADDLIEADKLGGMPVPSIAVVKQDMPIDKYGEITLVGTRSMVDPRATRRNRVFGADIHSPTRPHKSWKAVLKADAEKVYSYFDKTSNELKDGFNGLLWDAMRGSNPDYNKALELFDTQPTPKIQYLREKGYTIDPLFTETRGRYDFTNDPQFVAWWKENADRINTAVPSQDFYKSPEMKEFAAQLHEAVVRTNVRKHGEKDGQAIAEHFWGQMRQPDGGVTFNTFDQARYDLQTAGRRQLDRYETDATATRMIEQNNLKQDYKDWAEHHLTAFGTPNIMTGDKYAGTARYKPYTLENVVRYMMNQPIRGEEIITSPGVVAAQAAPEFKSITEMHQNEGRLVDTATFEAAQTESERIALEFTSRLYDFANDYGHYNPFVYSERGMDALAEYARRQPSQPDPELMQKALEKAGVQWDDPDMAGDLVDAALKAYDAIKQTPTQYFEAKPQRVVGFGEWAGAVIPQNIDPKVIDILERRGIPYRTYDPNLDYTRTKAISEYYQNDNVLFQSSGVLRDRLKQVQEMGFVPANAVKSLFMDVQDPRSGPAYIQGLVRYILDKRQQYESGQITTRDVAKSYVMTVSSQGASELPWKTVKANMEAKGIALTHKGQPIDIADFANVIDGQLKIRPEEYAALWLWTDQGQAALDKLDQGVVDVAAWRSFVDGRAPFGRFGRGVQYEMKWQGGKKVHVTDAEGNPIPKEYDGQWMIDRHPTRKNLQDIKDITDQINAAKGDQATIEAAIQQLIGVAEGKTYFVGHMLGFGTGSVVDTQQANFWAEAMRKTYPEIDPALLEPFGWGNWGKVVPELRGMIEDAYTRLRGEYNIGADIPPEAFTYAMHHWLWSVGKGFKGDIGPEHQGVYMVNRYGQGEKGGVHFLRDGRAVIKGLTSPDVSTLVHEIGHIFRRDLTDQADLETIARLGGLDGAAELADLQERFDTGQIMPGDPEYNRLVQAEENFARGWERYLAEGDAPTPELKGVFAKFTDWMLSIYRNLRATWRDGLRQVSGFDQEADFAPTGTPANIQIKINGRNLKDIFDRLIAERRVDDPELNPYQSPEPTPPSPQEQGILYQPVKTLPPQVRAGMQAVAQQLLNELEPSRIILQAYQDMEGGAEVTKYRRAWEGPYWFRQTLDNAKKAGMGTDKIKSQYTDQLKSIISGRDTGKAAIAGEVKALILERALGTGQEQNIQPAILRYFGKNDELFTTYADQILSSEQPALEAMFGDEWSQVVDDALLWASEHDVTPTQADGTDILDNPAEPIAVNPPPTGEPVGPSDVARDFQGQVDLFGNPVEPPAFNLQQQQAAPETFKPQEQAPQGALFDRGQYMQQIQAVNGGDAGSVPPTEDQPTLFQNGQVPPQGSPTIDPWGSALDESLVEQILPLLGEVEKRYNASQGQKGLKFSELDPQAQGDVKDWLEQVRGQMASTKFAAMSYGEQMRDAALLNYTRRYGLDNVLDFMAPYQFWYTRSVMEWSKRMVDRPAWFGMYARLLDMQQRQAHSMPERLRGKMRLPAPWLPDWAGGGLWVDPISKFLPFSTFGQPMERYQQNLDQINQRAGQVLDEMVKADQITQAEADQALSTRSGKAWDQATAQAQVDTNQGAAPTNLVSMMLSPSLWWTTGSALLNGHPEQITNLPITRTSRALETMTQGTALEPLGKIAGLGAWPETQLRKAAGLNEFGQWGPYYIDRQLANMAADGAATPEQARIAMIERDGNPVFEQARQRVLMEQAYQVPGAAWFGQVAKGNVINSLQALPTLIFGGTLFPTGELKLKGLQAEFSQAWKDRNKGDNQAMNNFFAKNPEYEARLALNQKPEERLKQFLISEVWDRYSSQEKANRSLSSQVLGDKFQNAFLNSKTRNYDAITPDELARWSMMLGANASNLPNVPEVSAARANPEPPVNLFPPAMAAKIEDYQTQRAEQFPNYYALQSAYYDLPATDKKGRREFLKRFPVLPKYWDWNRQYKAQHQDLAPYFNRTQDVRQPTTGTQTLTDKDLAQVDSVLAKQIVVYKMAGQNLTSGAWSEINRLAKAKGLDPQEYIDRLAASLVPTAAGQ